MICHEGRKHADSIHQKRVAKEMKAKALKNGSKKKGGLEEETAKQNVFEMDDEELGEADAQGAQPKMTKAEKELAGKARAHRTKSNELAKKARLVPAKFKLPKHKAFTYKGCQC